MQCPACGKVMALLEYREVEVDFCPSCGGCWLEPGSFERLTGTPAFLSATPEGSSTDRRHCPRCRLRMRVQRVPGTRVHIDQCPRDRGIWFDRGELYALTSAGPQADTVTRLAFFFEDLFWHKTHNMEV